MNVSQFCIKNYKLHHVGWENPIKFPFFFHLSSLKKKKNTSTEENVRKCMLYCVQSNKEAVSKNENNKSYF